MGHTDQEGAHAVGARRGRLLWRPRAAAAGPQPGLRNPVAHASYRGRRGANDLEQSRRQLTALCGVKPHTPAVAEALVIVRSLAGP
jgi:hypothetical protein